MKIEESEAYIKLHVIIETDECGWDLRVRREKLNWVVSQATHYAEVLGVESWQVLEAWEKERSYWYMNYYQEANMPTIKADRVRVFDTVEDLMSSLGFKKFRCPFCNEVSTSPYECDSLKKVTHITGKVAPCNWAVRGLFRDLGKGIVVVTKDRMKPEIIFMPVAWETV